MRLRLCRSLVYSVGCWWQQGSLFFESNEPVAEQQETATCQISSAISHSNSSQEPITNHAIYNIGTKKTIGCDLLVAAPELGDSSATQILGRGAWEKLQAPAPRGARVR